MWSLTGVYASLGSDRNTLQELSSLISQKINESKFEEALSLTRKIQNLSINCMISYHTSAHLINIGCAIKSADIVKEGLQALEKDFEKICEHTELIPNANYNRTNAYLVLFGLENAKNPQATLFNKTKLDTARHYYKQAINTTAITARVI